MDFIRALLRNGESIGESGMAVLLPTLSGSTLFDNAVSIKQRSFAWVIGVVVAVVAHLAPLNGAELAVPILVYHRFGSIRTDSMTVTTTHFKQQMELLAKHGYKVIPLASFVDWRLGRGPEPSKRSVVLTFDDGHRSVYSDARRIVEENHSPVTLFIYPSCISRASYAMTWEELSELAASPFFTLQSHTFWHPNFKQESKKQDQDHYSAFVDMQLKRSKLMLEQRIKKPVELLAWPFGIYDAYLMDRASAASYSAAFTIECRAATASDPLLALPRCLVSDAYTGDSFLQLLDTSVRNARKEK